MPSRLPSVRRAAGFTLVEMLVTVMVLVVLASLAGPGMYRLIAKKRLVAAAEGVRSDLSLAQTAAVTTARFAVYMGVSFKQDASGTCYALYASNTFFNDCDCRGSTVSCLSTGSQSVLKTVSYAATDAIRLEARAITTSPAVYTQLAFRSADGRLINKANLAWPDAVIRVYSQAGGEMRISVNDNGVIEICSLDAQHAGYARC